MPLLIDGDNYLGTSRRPRTDAERARLVREFDRLREREGTRAILVFDGTAPPSLSLGSDVQFAGRHASADDRILQRLRGEADVRGWTVVTSDRSLGDRCRSLGARLVRCHEFRRRLKPATGPEKPEREEDIDYWLEQFRE